MPKPEIARLFQNGRSQAVRLPRDFRFAGDKVRISRVARGVLLEPIIQNPKDWFKSLDELNFEPFVFSRRQPKAPKRILFR